MKDKRILCTPGKHKFIMDSAPYFKCEKCGLWNDEYDFEHKTNHPGVFNPLPVEFGKFGSSHP